MSIAQDEGYLAGYFIKGSSLTGCNPSMAAPTDVLSDTIQLILSCIVSDNIDLKRLCVGVNRITSRLMCCYGGSVSLPLMDSLLSDYQTEMNRNEMLWCLFCCINLDSHTCSLTHLCWLHMQQQSMRYKAADSVKHNVISTFSNKSCCQTSF